MKYQIQDFIFEVDNEAGIPVPANMEHFRYNGENPADYFYHIVSREGIAVEETEFLFESRSVRICCAPSGGERRYLYFPESDVPYAVSTEMGGCRTEIVVEERCRAQFALDTVFGSLMSPERRMDERGHYILHCNMAEYAGSAILFTAPSGTGKSTQGELWRQYRGARVINGDRSLLVKKKDGFYACGWPICGSSGICVNESYPVRCIVVLEKGVGNEIHRAGYVYSFKKLLSEITVNHHNREFIGRAMDFVEEVAGTVPVYFLSCDISEAAVACLENRLREDGLLEE